MRILVVEDEPKLASLLQRALGDRGHQASVVARGDIAVRAATEHPFDAIVLDVMLPGLGGLEVCRRLREQGVESAIVMLTARDAIDDRVLGLQAGADDYLVKPFALKELYARIDAVQRRIAVSHRQVAQHARETVECGHLRVEPSSLTAYVDGEPVDLRPKECALLALLVRRAGHVVSRYEILEEAWEGDVDYRSNVVEVQIKRLREKVDRPFGHSSIETLRGVGYRFRAAR